MKNEAWGHFGRLLGACSLSKSRKIVPWGRWGGILGDLGVPGRSQDAPPHLERNSKINFLAEMVAPRVDLGAQLVASGGPKSNLLAKSRYQIVKKSFQEEPQKKHRKISKTLCRKYVFGEGKSVQIRRKGHQNHGFQRFAKTLKNDSKKVNKNQPKSITNRPWGAIWSTF